MNASFNYNENNVVKFTVNQDENETKNETKKMEVASASIDVSSLGGSSTLAIVPDLQAVTISATTDTSLENIANCCNRSVWKLVFNKCTG